MFWAAESFNQPIGDWQVHTTIRPDQPWITTCDNFATDPCTAAEAAAHTLAGKTMGFTDFDPGTVNWAIQSKWRSAGACNESEDSGCLIPAAAGWAIVIGFSLGFSVLTVILNMIERKVSGIQDTSEQFNTAGRNIKIGLTGSVIVSQWTWAATLLQSSNKAWQLGVSGPFWYASGATVQVLLFGILAIKVKQHCPNAHTFLEIVDARWGKAAHITFLIFGFFTNILVTGMLLLGGAAVMNASAGINTQLCSFLMPWGVIAYTLVGGLKATFMAGYLHTSIIMIGLTIMITAVYWVEGDILGKPPLLGSGPCVNTEQCNAIGSAGAMWERLAYVITLPSNFPNQGPVTGNKGGSYLTMMSNGGFAFGVINTVGNFGTVFVDQSYWQSAIAASPASAHKGYMLGGLVWFSIPFALATSLGLAGIAMNADITANDANAGLVPPISATILMGTGGGVLMITMLFMAITSTGSAEMIAVSSLITYDIYRKYINPKADGKKILLVSRIMVGFFGLIMGIIAVVFNAFGIEEQSFDADTCTWSSVLDAEGNVKYTGLSMGWVYVFMGNMIGSAVCPVAFAVLWKDCNAAGAILGAWAGLIGSLVSWMVVASAQYCAVNYWSLFMDTPLLVGNLVAILLSGAICVVFGLVAPQNYDWKKMNEHITRVEENKDAIADWELTPEHLDKALEWSLTYGVGVTLFLLIGWPVFLAHPLGVFPKGVYAIWVAVSFFWGYAGMFIIVFLPIWENKEPFIKALTCKFDGAKPAVEVKEPQTAAA
jgi:SSS family transporter